MALTATLNDPQPQGQPITTPSSGGFLSGLADFGKEAIGSLSSYQANADRKETEAAQNDAAQAIQDNFKAASASLGVPQDVVAAGQRLTTAQSAATNGSMTQGAVDLHLESTLDDLYAKHPEKKAVIATYLQSQGLDHYLFRDVKANIAASDDAAAVKQKAEDFAYDAAAHSGYGNPQLDDRATMISKGQTFLNNQAQLKLATDKLDLANKTADLDAKSRTALEKNGQQGLLQGFAQDAEAKTGQVHDHLSALFQEAQIDPSGTSMTTLKQTIPAIINGIETAKASAVVSALAHNANKDTVDNIKTIYDTYKESISAAWTGDLSQDALTHQTLTAMQDKFGINAGQAYPLYNTLAKLPGAANWLPLAFGGDPAHAMSKEQQDAISKEMKGVTLGSPDGIIHYMKVADILRGNLHLQNMTLPEAQKLIPTLNTTVVGNGAAIVKGDKSAETAQSFLTGIGQLSSAAATLSPGTNLDSQLTASSMLSDNAQRGRSAIAALVKLSHDPNQAETATPVLIHVNGTAQRGVLTAKSGDWQHDGSVEKRQKLVYDTSSQTVKVVIDEDAYKTYLTDYKRTAQDRSQQLGDRNFSAAQSTLPPLSRDDIMKNPDSALSKRATTINQYLNTFVQTYQANPNNPKGITPRIARDSAFNGTPLDRVAREQTSGQSFDQRVNNLRSEAQNLTLNTASNDSQDVVNTQAGQAQQKREQEDFKFYSQQGLPSAAVAGILGNFAQESGGNPAGKAGDGGISQGKAQWNNERLAGLHTFAAAAGRDWKDNQVQNEFVMHELQTSHAPAMNALRSAKTPEEAARAFALYFEHPKGAETGSSDKISGITNRIDNAKRIYAQNGQTN